MNEVFTYLLEYTQKLPSRLRPFWHTQLGITSTHSLEIQLKYTLQNTIVFPYGSATQCIEQIASHTTTFPMQYTLLEGLAPCHPFWKVLRSEMDRQRPIPPPTLSNTFFQKTYFIKFTWISCSYIRFSNFITFVGVRLTELHNEAQTWNSHINSYRMRDPHLRRMRLFTQILHGSPYSYTYVGPLLRDKEITT